MKLDFDTNLPALTSAAAFANGVASGGETNEISQKLQAGVKAAQEGKRAEAKTLLLEVTELEPENENAWLWLASISEYPEELLVFLNNVLSVNPNNERALQWAQATNSLLSKTFVERGIGASRENQKGFAKQCFLQATVHENENETAWLRLASLSDSVEEKTAYLNKILSFDSENQAALTALESAKKQVAKSLLPQAIAEAFAGEGAAALETLEEILAEAPEMEEVWLLKSYLVSTVNEKIICFDKVLELNPDNELAHANDDFLRLLTAKLTEPQKPDEESETTGEIYQVTDFEEIGEVAGKTASNKIVCGNLPGNSEKNEMRQLAECEDQEKLLGETYFAEIIPEDAEEATDDEHAQHFSSGENFEEEAESDFELEREVNFQSEEEQEETSLESLEEYRQIADEEMPIELAHEEEEISGDFDMPNESGVKYNPEMNYASPVEEIDKFFAEDDEIFDMSELPAANDVNFSEEPEFAGSNFDENENSLVEENLPSYYEMDEEVLSLGAADEANSSFNSAKTEKLPTDFLASIEEPVNNFPPSDLPETFSCPFCYADNEPQTSSCKSCHAMLSLSDLEMLLAHTEGDNETVCAAVEGMEAEKTMREFSGEELKFLGVGLINLKRVPEGFACLEEAAKLAPADVLLSSQTNALANRLSENAGNDDSQASPVKSKKILVVDDSATVRKLISGKLEKCGHEVFCAVDGIDALEKIEEIMPDLILLDINMPRMDGYEACQMIRSNEKTKDVPIVMISGNDGFFDKVRGKMAGTTGYITKPFGPETLMKTVENYIV